MCKGFQECTDGKTNDCKHRLLVLVVFYTHIAQFAGCHTQIRSIKFNEIATDKSYV